jgi:hypothetical protein
MKDNSIHRIHVHAFGETFANCYLTANEAMRGVIESMSRIIADPSATAEERESAIDTLLEVLFPKSKN